MIRFLKRYTYQSILNSLPEACQIRDFKNRVIADNPAGKKLFGRGKNPFAFLGEQDVPVLQKLTTAFLKKIPFSCRLTWQGQTYFVFLHPRAQDILLRAYDITAETAVNQAIHDKKILYKNLLNFLPFPLYLCSEAGNLLYVNQALCKLFQSDSETLLSKSWTSLFTENAPELSGIWEGTVLLNTPVKAPLSVQQFPLSAPEGYFCGILTPIHHTSSDETLFHALPFATLKIDVLSHHIQGGNTAFSLLFKNDIPETLDDFFTPDACQLLYTRFTKMLQGNVGGTLDLTTTAQYDFKTLTTSLFWQTPEKDTVLLLFTDTGERKNLENQVIHAQKMQAIGQLAGGIAHDFNNILTAIIGFCDLLQEKVPSEDALSDIFQIKGNAQKASGLISQLLTFSRKQPIKLKTISVYDALMDLTALLKRTLSPFITLRTDFKKKLGYIKMDVNQLTQIFLNLAVNSKDAMPQGGVFSITAVPEKIKKSKQLGTDLLPAGDYTKITVSDTGSGIDKKDLPHIFEPFFSTKTDSVASGTGLGLSTVYGIIKTAHAFIGVDSERGVGTTFTLYFPLVSKEETELPSYTRPNTPKELVAPTQTILLVDDEEGVRLVSARALRHKGYTVIECTQAQEALEKLKIHSFDLLITDMIMPGMDGETLCHQAIQIQPQLKMILMSGYSQDLDRHGTQTKAPYSFLQKPFDLNQMLKKVQEVLES